MIGNYSVFVLFIVLLMAYGCVVEPDYGPRPVDTFIKYYGISGSNEVVDMIISNEGNLVILGNEESSAAGASKDIVILEIDTVGNLIKKRIFDIQTLFLDDSLYTFGITDDQAVRIKTVDGGYLLCANFTTKDDNVNGIGSKIFGVNSIITFNIIGKQVISDAGYYWEVGDIIKSRDGNIVIVGGTNKKEGDMPLGLKSNDILLRDLLKMILFFGVKHLDTMMWMILPSASLNYQTVILALSVRQENLVIRVKQV